MRFAERMFRLRANSFIWHLALSIIPRFAIRNPHFLLQGAQPAPQSGERDGFRLNAKTDQSPSLRLMARNYQTLISEFSDRVLLALSLRRLRQKKPLNSAFRRTPASFRK
jgi:hypothetical protein